jgi:hypothetical protein
MGSLMYAFFMVATAANAIGPVAIGRPIPWLVPRLLVSPPS